MFADENVDPHAAEIDSAHEVMRSQLSTPAVSVAERLRRDHEVECPDYAPGLLETGMVEGVEVSPARIEADL